ncbi:MAG TPA: hypothetical protein VL992_04205 [Tepidisphaeraceae bacterium]|nr:hypothetical protein [Tepidisphaeraceae bacterium]
MSEQTPIAPPTGDPPPSEPSAPQALATPGGDVVARAGKYYRNTRYILAAALFFWGLYNIRDGFFNWPAQNQHYAQVANARGLDPNAKPHSDADILINQGLGILLPPLGIFLLVWMLRSSRGEIRLSNDVLSVPGHPPVPLIHIESIDKQKWDRKGIAMLSYRLDSGKVGKIKLDDFVYERPPIDRIFERVEQSLQSPRPRKVAAAPSVPRPKMPPPPPRPKL